MKVDALFELCCGMFGEKVGSCGVWRNGFLAMVNGILAECFSLENGIREKNKQEVLQTPQVVQAFDDEIVYDEELLRKCMVWGICTLLAVSDGDGEKASLFHNKYEYEKMLALRGRYVDMEDCY